MSIQIGICDDNEEDIRILSEGLYAYDSSVQISTYTYGEYLLEDCCNSEIVFDIIFLDIYMPGLNGIETARKIRYSMKDTKIIFVSSSSDHYPEAYDVFAFNYMLKPLNTEKLNYILDQAFVDIERQTRQQINFSYKSKTYRIFCRDIEYIESSDKHIHFYMVDKKVLQCYAKIDEILKQLPENSFIRCHQSFIVNISLTNEMGGNYFRIGTTVISISKKYQKVSKDKYFEYLFNHINKGIV